MRPDSETLVMTGDYAPSVLRAGHVSAPEAQAIDLSGRHSYRLYAVQDGTVTLTGGGLREVVGPGHALLFWPGPWRLELAPRSVLLHAVFDVVAADRRRSERGDLVHVVPARTQPSPRAVWGVELPVRVPARFEPLAMATLNIIQMNYWRHGAGYALACGHLSRFLGELAPWARRREEDTAGEAEGGPLVRDALRMLRDPQSRPAKVGDASRLLGVSREHLSRRIREETGHSPQEIIAQRRRAMATHLLTATDLPLKRVAARVGYSHLSSFIRAFGKWFGLTPEAYRRQRGGKGPARAD